MLLFCGVLLFLSLIIPPADAGGIVKIAFLRDLSLFALNYTPPGVDNRKKEPPGGGSFLYFPVDTGADIRYRYR